MADILVRLEGVPEEVLETLIKRGYYKTKSEAVRAGILELGKEFAVIGSPAYYRHQLAKLTLRSKLTPEEVMRRLEKLEE